MLQFNIFRPYLSNLIHGITEKKEGSFNDEEPVFANNLKVLCKKNDISRPVFANQLHRDSILVLDKRPALKPGCDGFITQKQKLPLMIKVADCQGVLMYDPTSSTIAAVHCGWKGSARNIIGKTIQKMQEQFKVDPQNLLIGISPSLGPENAKFTDPKNELPLFCQPYIKGDNVDFWSLSIAQCLKEGVPKKQIELLGICTINASEQFFSYRRGDAGRMAVFIALK